MAPYIPGMVFQTNGTYGTYCKIFDLNITVGKVPSYLKEYQSSTCVNLGQQ